MNGSWLPSKQGWLSVAAILELFILILYDVGMTLFRIKIWYSNGWKIIPGTPIQGVILTTCIWKRIIRRGLDGATIAACPWSFALHWWQLKMWKVILLHSAMSQLSFKLHKNENNTDISLYVFTKIRSKYLEIQEIKFIQRNNHQFQLWSPKRLWNLLQAFLMVSLFKLVNATVILAFRSSLV